MVVGSAVMTGPWPLQQLTASLGTPSDHSEVSEPAPSSKPATADMIMMMGAVLNKIGIGISCNARRSADRGLRTIFKVHTGCTAGGDLRYRQCIVRLLWVMFLLL